MRRTPPSQKLGSEPLADTPSAGEGAREVAHDVRPMHSRGMPEIAAIEIVEDYTDRARCDEGFLRLQRLRARNRRADGSASREYPIDVIDRPTLDAVAVCLYARTPAGVEILTRRGLRPAAYFRRGKVAALPEREYLLVEELVAGVLEPGEVGLDALRRRGADEVREEAGIEIAPEALTTLGGPFFPLPGIVSEKIHLLAGEVPRPPGAVATRPPRRATALRSRRARCSRGASSARPSRRASAARSRTRRPSSRCGGSSARLAR